MRLRLQRFAFSVVFIIGTAFVTTTVLTTATTQVVEAKSTKKKRAKKKRPAARAPKAKAGKAKEPKQEAPPPAAAPSSDLVPTTQFRGPTRIDFDDRLIQGQTNKTGAVYLFDRKETGISSMVRRRKSFRHLTVGTIYDR